MGRRKCLIIPVLMAGILLMGGCSRQSIEDVKRFQETSKAVENQTNQTGIIQENESRENKVDNVFAGMVSSSPKYAERYSDVDMEIYTGKLVTKFTYSIGETAIAENVDELSKLMSEEDIAEYIKYDTETPEKFSAYDKMINEDGTFANDRKGIKQVALLMKLKITNNGDEDFQFLSNGFRLYCFRYNEQDDATYYSTIESRQSYLNIHDDHEIFRHHLTIKPGETKEVVAMEVIPYVSASRINGGPVGRRYDVDNWIKPVGVATNRTMFTLIPEDKVTELGVDVMVESAVPDAKTFEALNMLQSVTTQGADMLMQRVNASDGYPNDPCSLQIKDNTYIAFVTAAGKYGVIHVIEAANDADALVTGGCKIATPTGVVGGKGPAYSGAGIAGLTYDGVALLYGRTCKLKIVVQK